MGRTGTGQCWPTNNNIRSTTCYLKLYAHTVSYREWLWACWPLKDTGLHISRRSHPRNHSSSLAQQKATTEMTFWTSTSLMSIDIKYPMNSKPVLHSYHAHPNRSRWSYGSKARIGCSDAIAPAEIPSTITWKVYRFAPYRARQNQQNHRVFLLYIEPFMRVNSLPKKSTLLYSEVKSEVMSSHAWLSQMVQTIAADLFDSNSYGNKTIASFPSSACSLRLP